MFALSVRSSLENQFVGVFSTVQLALDEMYIVRSRSGYTNDRGMLFREVTWGFEVRPTVRYFEVCIKGSSEWSLLFMLTEVELDVALAVEMI